MFGKNWGIIIEIGNERQCLEQLYNIFKECRHVYMLDYYNAFSSLRYAISMLEERLGIKNDELNGSTVPYDTVDLIYQSFDEALFGFNDNAKFKTWLTNHIFALHNYIDQTADAIPVMLTYYKKLKSMADGTYKPKSWDEYRIMNKQKKISPWNHIPAIHLYNIAQNIVPLSESSDSGDSY